MKQKKNFLIVLLCVLFTVPYGMTAHAESMAEETEYVEDIIQDFLQNYTEESMLYTDENLTAYTVADANIPLSPYSVESTYHLSSGDATLQTMRENISFVEEKAQYFKEMRQYYNIQRTDLHLDYHFEELTLDRDANTGFARVSEVATFYYTDYDQPTLYETIYDIDLVNLDGVWLIADVTDNDWFDINYKSDAGFQAQDVISDTIDTIESALPSTIVVPAAEDALTTEAEYRIRYNGENARAYAWTYTRDDPSADPEDFYNDAFEDYPGTDCMNFASQCMWAGFSGSQTRDSINNHDLPMDEDGSFVWYGAAKGKYNNSNSWTSCQNFRKYLTGNLEGTGTSGSNEDTDVGMYAQVIDVERGENISGTSARSLVGAVVHTKGSKGPYAHAIVITDASSLDRSDIYFCSHTTDHKNTKLADKYPAEPMMIFIPQYMRSDESTLDYIKTEMIPPIAYGETETITFSITRPQDRMTLIVTDPNGEYKQTSVEDYPTECSLRYTFRERGLHRVDCYARAKPTSEAVQSTYYIYCY